MRAATTLRLLLALWVAGSAHAEQAPFVIAPPPLSGDDFAWATDVSADGQRVVGVSRLGGCGPPSVCNAVVLWDGLGPAVPIASSYSIPDPRISADGSTIVGVVSTRQGGEAQGFRWNAIDGLVYFPTDASLQPSFVPLAASADGSVLYGSASACDSLSCGRPAARWEAGVVSIVSPYPDEISVESIHAGLIGAASDGRVVGYGSIPWRTAFVSNGVTTEPLFTPGYDPSSCFQYRVSNDGSAVAGYCHVVGLNPVPVLWSLEGTPGFAEFQVPGYARDASDGGRVVVGFLLDHPGSDSSTTAFVRDEATGVRAIADVLQAGGADPTGVTLRKAHGVSADGRTVVGENFIARLPESVPEAEALVCGVAALAALSGLARIA